MRHIHQNESSTQDITPLLLHIERYVQLMLEEKVLLSKHLQIKKLAKKEHLLHAGQVCSSLSFILKGCLRLYLEGEDGNQQTLQFGIENWWLADFMSFSTQKPSGFSIQAVEPCTVVLWEQEVMEEMCEKIPQLERYFRLVMQRAYAASQMRIQFIYSESGEERYRHFSQCFPDFVQRVPQYMLASYLGFTPEFLSKIRAKKA